MFRTAPRIIARTGVPRALTRAAPARRCISTAPPTQKSRSWKSSAARWGVAGAIIYYYNTTDVFAEEPKYAVQALPETDNEHETYPTIEAISQQRQQRKAELAAATEAKATVPIQGNENATGAQDTAGTMGSPQELEEEAGQQGAFNPETGEINWDCPCLGGMADGPCGEEFKAAFSCFVFSEEDPKGMDCIDKFKGMQTCFRQYPEIYGAELDSDEEDDVTADSPLPPTSNEASSPTPESADSSSQESKHKTSAPTHSTPDEQVRRDHAPVSENEDVVPKATHDARDATVEKK